MFIDYLFELLDIQVNVRCTVTCQKFTYTFDKLYCLRGCLCKNGLIKISLEIDFA